MAELLALDSNVYIGALRNADRLARLKRFLLRVGLRVRLSAVVALELRAGARTAAQESAVRDLFASHVTRDRVLIPSFAAYAEGGRVLAALAARERVDVARGGSLVNDVLLATSCREADVRLVTENVRDFAAVQRHLRGFRFAAAEDILVA